jgi:hypothetical protein
MTKGIRVTDFRAVPDRLPVRLRSRIYTARRYSPSRHSRNNAVPGIDSCALVMRQTAGRAPDNQANTPE